VDRRNDRLPLTPGVTLLDDHRQKRLFPTTIGGGATVKSSDKWRVTSKAPPKQIFEICSIGLGLGRSVLPCRHVITDDRAGSARFRLGNALFVEVQPPDSPEVRLSEIFPAELA
jgi:hypothetical protein